MNRTIGAEGCLNIFCFQVKTQIKFSSNGKKYEKWLENEPERYFMIIPVVYCYRSIIAKLLNSVNTTRKGLISKSSSI